MAQHELEQDHPPSTHRHSRVQPTVSTTAQSGSPSVQTWPGPQPVGPPPPAPPVPAGSVVHAHVLSPGAPALHVHRDSTGSPVGSP
jgi:hypothetical protein